MNRGKRGVVWPTSELVRCHFAAVKNFRVEGCGEKERVRQSSLPVTQRYGTGQDRGGETQNGEG